MRIVCTNLLGLGRCSSWVADSPWLFMSRRSKFQLEVELRNDQWKATHGQWHLFYPADCVLFQFFTAWAYVGICNHFHLEGSSSIVAAAHWRINRAIISYAGCMCIHHTIGVSKRSAADLQAMIKFLLLQYHSDRVSYMQNMCECKGLGGEGSLSERCFGSFDR
jgi:hypothetical protein